MKHLKVFASVLTFIMVFSSSVFAASTQTKDADNYFKNDSGKTLIRKISTNNTNDISVLIISKKGTVVACDPMTMPDNAKLDLITVSHDHHLENAFVNQFKDLKKSINKVEKFTVKDIKVTGIAASHTEAPINVKAPRFVVYAYDIDGLRIAYFACIGQKELTKDQLKDLGKIDIALITTDNYPGFISVEKACAIIKQLKPKVTIPLSHHYSDYDSAIEDMSKVAGPIKVVDGAYVFSKTDIKDGKQKVIQLNNLVAKK